MEISIEEIRAEFDDMLPAKENNYGFARLDGEFILSHALNRIFKSFFQLSEQDRYLALKKAKKFINDLDSALEHQCGVPFGSNVMPTEMMQAFAEEYIKNELWHSDYFTWMMINSFLVTEADAFQKHLEKKHFLNPFSRLFGVPRKHLQVLARLNHTKEASEMRTYSPEALLLICNEASRLGCFIHPMVYTLLKFRSKGTEALVVFPDGVRSPKEIENLFGFGRR